MTIKTWKNSNRSCGYDTVLSTDCAGDKGLETAWNQVTTCIDNGVRPEDVNKIVSKLTKTPDHYDREHLRRVGLRAAERYCLGKLLTGETEKPENTSGRWDPLKNAITKEFLEDFSIQEVYIRINEYFISIAGIHAQVMKDPKSLVYYGPGFMKYPHDMTKRDLLVQASSKENRYWTEDHKAKVEAAKADFEIEVSKVNLNKYKFTSKDQERVDVLVAWKHKGSDKSTPQANKIGTVDKAVSRFILGLKSGMNFPAFRYKAIYLGATRAEIEALARHHANTSVYKVNFEDCEVRPR